MKTVTYQLSNDEIANPERGLFTQYESNAKDYVALSYLRKLRSEGKTLVQLMYYLDDYRDKDLPEGFATKLEVDLDQVREAGMKASCVSPTPTNKTEQMPPCTSSSVISTK